MTNRAFFLSHPRYQENLKLVINTLLNNDYPLSFIFDVIELTIEIFITQMRFHFQKEEKKRKKRDIMNAFYNMS